MTTEQTGIILGRNQATSTRGQRRTRRLSGSLTCTDEEARKSPRAHNRGKSSTTTAHYNHRCRATRVTRPPPSSTDQRNPTRTIPRSVLDTAQRRARTVGIMNSMPQIVDQEVERLQRSQQLSYRSTNAISDRYDNVVSLKMVFLSHPPIAFASGHSDRPGK